MVSDNKNKNVYVGHRYVPKIFGVWDKLKTYEGLSIVTWEGSSYTSKKRVPEGVDILNEEYWVVTGNYNAQVENYRQEVRDVQDELTDMQDEFDDTFNSLSSQLAQTVKQGDFTHNVKDYGVIGDGVTDDTQAIQECVNNFETIFFPEGTYLITDTIEINKNVRMVGVEGYSIIYMDSQDITTYMFKSVTLPYVEQISIDGFIFNSVTNKPDASHFDRISDNVFSNVRVLDCNNFGTVTIKNCVINELEGLVFANDTGGQPSDLLLIKNVRANNVQCFIFGSWLDEINIHDCVIYHKNSSRLDHSFYIAHDNNIVKINNVETYNNHGVSIMLASVDGYANTFNEAYINNCVVDNPNGAGGGLYIMYGTAYVDNVLIKTRITNSFQFRNKGGNLFVSNSKTLANNGGFVLLSDDGSGANPTAIPNTYFLNCNFECQSIEAFQDVNNVGGKREFVGCDFFIKRSGLFRGAIVNDSPNAEYLIKNCSLDKGPWYIVPIIDTSEPIPINIINCFITERFSLFNGDGTNVLAVNNVCYHEKGDNVTGGKFVGNTVIT